MDLTKKFKMVTSCQPTKITCLKIGTPYPIDRAERVQTKFGEAILTTLRAESPHTFVKVFLPRRYGSIFSDDDLRSINDKTISLSLKYLGIHTASNSYILELDILTSFFRWSFHYRIPSRLGTSRETVKHSVNKTTVFNLFTCIHFTKISSTLYTLFSADRHRGARTCQLLKQDRPTHSFYLIWIRLTCLFPRTAVSHRGTVPAHAPAHSYLHSTNQYKSCYIQQLLIWIMSNGNSKNASNHICTLPTQR